MAGQSRTSTPPMRLPQLSSDQRTSIPHTSIIQIDDSASDVSMSADSEDEDATSHLDAAGKLSESEYDSGPSMAFNLSKKRKHSDSIKGSASGHKVPQDLETHKRLRPDPEFLGHRTSHGHLHQDRSLIPAEIWQCIFTYIPPRTLGSLLCVNKAFNAYLDPSSERSFSALFKSSAAQVIQPNAIWRASRRLFRPQMPLPLADKTELDMWRLGCCASCQFCGKKRPTDLPHSDSWHPGPGEQGVSSIWAFAVCSCGACLQSRTMKEIDLLLSSSIPSPLMPALPFVFLTSELHMIPSATLQVEQQPSSIQIGKQFFKSHVDAIKAEFVEVKIMGSATVEEWFKGLDERGKQCSNDAARWERYEGTGGVARMRYSEPQESQQVISTSQIAIPTPFERTPSRPPFPLPAKPLPAALPRIPQPIQNGSSVTGPLPQRLDSPANFGSARTPMFSKHERTKEDVAEVKAARKAEIERRAMMLDPPLTAPVLTHMSSFQAAVQIIQPLDDHAWEVLRPRLIAQQYDAERREKERLVQNLVVEEQFDERHLPEMPVRSSSKELGDSHWDDLQAPLRARIGGYADEIVHNSWNSGNAVTKDNAPTFAAQVLIYVRKRFYADMAKDDVSVRASTRQSDRDLANGSYPQKLVLENMKWVFDTKIKPHTEQYSKELFLCSVCGNNFKYYGFEGVIQHYAAKHTSSLSVGTIVVHWKAEWPEDAPFHPDPTSIGGKNSYQVGGANGGVSYPAAHPSSHFSYGGYQAPSAAPTQLPTPHVFQGSPAPFYGTTPYGDQYGPPRNGPFPPPQAYQDHSQDFQPYPRQPYVNGPQSMPTNGYHDHTQRFSQPGFNSSYAAAPQAPYPSPYTGSAYPNSNPHHATQQLPYTSSNAPYGSSYFQPPSAYTAPAPAPSITQPVQRSEEYMTQLQDLAKHAREIWNIISTVKDVPGSVKVVTIIFHILTRSREAFQSDPPLSMLMDGLSNNKDMRPVRNVNGLVCRACTLNLPGTPAHPDKKHYSFPQLVNHFFSVHEQDVVQKNLGPVPDWTKDMLEMPDKSRLRQVQQAPGMDNKKLMLYVEALPEITAPDQEAEDPQADSIFEDRRGAYGDLPSSHDDHDRYYAKIDKDANESYDHARYESQTQSGVHTGFAGSTYPHSHQDQGINHDRRREVRREIRPISPHSQIRPMTDRGFFVVREEAHPSAERYSRPYEVATGDHRRIDLGTARTDHDHALVGRLPPTGSYTPRMSRGGSTAPEYKPGAAGMHRLNDAVASQHNRLSDIVAQISQHAQEARGRQSIKREPVEGVPEDDDVRGELTSTRFEPVPTSDEASHAAERFLNSFLPGEGEEGSQQNGMQVKSADSGVPARRDTAYAADLGQVYEHCPPTIRIRESYDDDRRLVDQSGRVLYTGDQPSRGSFLINERQPDPTRPYTYEERYIPPSDPLARDGSPILVDQRYKVNNVIYREDRQVNTARRTPSRYARYESVRLGNEREHSRSPNYVQLGPQGQQYLDRIPSGQAEPYYQSRPVAQAGQTPQDEMQYGRDRPRELYRIYADEQRPRLQQPPQFAQAFEYVQMRDAQGDFVIRRPVRREADSRSNYDGGATYERSATSYEARPSIALSASSHRGDVGIVSGSGATRMATAPGEDEEYDPRHPAPMPAMDGRARRY